MGQVQLSESVCDQFITDIREQAPAELLKPPYDEEFLNQIMDRPWIDYLRRQIQEKDKPLLQRLMSSDHLLIKRLSISLTLNIDLDPEISRELSTIYVKIDDPDVRFDAMYRLLDNPELDLEILETIYRFTIGKNYEQWKAFVIKWQGGIDKIMQSVPKKIGKYPEHKAWVYLHELSWVPDNQKECAKEIIRGCLNFEWPTNEVAKALLEQMENELLIYVAKKVIEDLRSKKNFKEEVIKAVLLEPWVNTLRSCITQNERDLVLQLMSSPDQTNKRLGFSLAKELLGDKEIRLGLEKGFNEPDNKPDVRFEAIFRLLNYDDLDPELLRKIYEFTKQHINIFKEHILACEGGLEEIMKNVLEKIEQYPAHKAWIYLLELSWVPPEQKEAAIEIIKKYITYPFPTGEVAKGILERWGYIE